jgi:hypothetical protein
LDARFVDWLRAQPKKFFGDGVTECFVQHRSSEGELKTEAPVIAAMIESETSAAESGVNAIVAVLHQLRDLLRATTSEQYVMNPVGVVNSSIAGHVRHCLDHVATLLAGAITGTMDYDDRQRGTDVERSRLTAIGVIDQHIHGLEYVRECPLAQPISLQVLMSASGPATTVETSLGREVAFVLSHTVHHNALIAVIAGLLEIPTPDRFGYAPSTLAHMDKRRCAR